MFVPVMLTGIQAGALYALLALALVIIYKGTDVVNFVQGDFATLGIYFAIALTGTVGLPAVAVILISMVATALVGMLVEYLVARPLLKSNHPRRVLYVVIATLALQVVIQNIVRLTWGPDARYFPTLLPFKDVEIFGVVLSGITVGTVASAVLLVGLFFLFFKYTKLGVALRATSENPRGAQLMGINVRLMYSLSWAISGGIGALAGILLAHSVGPNPEIGASVLIKAFAAAALGGFHSLAGAIIGAVLVGLSENFAGFYVSGAVKDITAFGVIILVLMFRPQGLFGRAPQRKV